MDITLLPRMHTQAEPAEKADHCLPIRGDLLPSALMRVSPTIRLLVPLEWKTVFPTSHDLLPSGLIMALPSTRLMVPSGLAKAGGAVEPVKRDGRTGLAEYALSELSVPARANQEGRGGLAALTGADWTGRGAMPGW